MSVSPYSVFILEDNESFSMIIHKYLKDSLRERYPQRKFEIMPFSEASAGFEAALKRVQPQALILDFHLGGAGENEVTGTDIMKIVKSVSPGTEVVMLTSDDSLGLANSMMRSGAFDYIIKSPAAPIKVLKSVLTLMALEDSRAESRKNRKLIMGMGIVWFGLLLGAVALLALDIL